MENGPSPDADFQPIRLVSFALTVQTAADPDPCLSKRPGLACDALRGVGTSTSRPGLLIVSKRPRTASDEMTSLQESTSGSGPAWRSSKRLAR